MNKNIIRNKWSLLLVFLLAAAGMSIYEFIKELFFQGRLSPWESHSITIIFTSTTTTITASVVRSWAIAVYTKEQLVERREQLLRSFQLVLSASNHIINNVLNALKLVRLDIEEHGQVIDEHLQQLDMGIEEASKQMMILNRIQNPSDPDSYRDIYPN